MGKKRFPNPSKEDFITMKKEIFDDLHIPWSEEIESKFYAGITRTPNANPEMLLDRIAKDYMLRAYEDPEQSTIDWLKQKYGEGNPIRRRVFVDEIGESKLKTLVNTGVLVKTIGTNHYMFTKGNE